MSASESQKWNTSMKWSQMNPLTKLVFISKLFLMLSTLGFAFPNVLD